MSPAQRRVTRAVLLVSRKTLRAVLQLLVGGLLVAIAGLVYVLESRPDLEVWHKARLDEEFRVGSGVEDFPAYLELEGRLFAQLDREVYDEVEPSVDPAQRLVRYARGSLADPTSQPTNWNRSFELRSETPTVSILMLHGMSDSPYSMRSLAERMHAEGAHVVGLRIPGHGTAPSGLLDVEFEDMAAAVELAMAHLEASREGQPLYVFGYSNGGALAVLYALKTLEDDSLPKVDGLVLLSPEIGITPLAALAVWQERLGHLLGLRKLAWNSILPEYDPYQYKSFALNAGKQAHRITGEIQRRITRMTEAGALDRFPPMLAFQSVVDATVTAPALVEGLFQRIPGGRHELVLFDINRKAQIESILKGDPTGWIDRLLRGRGHPFTITGVLNESPESNAVVALQVEPGDQTGERVPLGVAWPPDVYSLSHIAPPFPPDDPFYGGPESKHGPGLHLGDIALRGEKGTLRIAAGDQLRMHWNPFHDFMMDRIVKFVESGAGTDSGSD